MIILITSILSLLALYFAIGFVFGIFFVIRGLAIVDPDASDAGWGLRLLLFPGSVAFWFILWRKWSLNSKKHK